MSQTAELTLDNRLTLGLMGLDELHLRVLAASSDIPKERKNARIGASNVASMVVPTDPSAVLNLLRKGRHWVLVVRYMNYGSGSTLMIVDRSFSSQTSYVCPF